jgi:hypothetical protein
MARRKAAVGGTAYSMESCCEYIEKNNQGQPTKFGPPAWGLGEVLITPQLKKN